MTRWNTKPRPLNLTGIFICPDTGKRQYETERAATAAIERAADQAGNVPVRCYVCPHCGLWHLTSTKEGELQVRRQRDWWQVGPPRQPAPAMTPSMKQRLGPVIADRRRNMVYGARLEDDRHTLHLAVRRGQEPEQRYQMVEHNAVLLFTDLRARFSYLHHIRLSWWPPGTPARMLLDLGFYTGPNPQPKRGR